MAIRFQEFESENWGAIRACYYKNEPWFVTTRVESALDLEREDDSISTFSLEKENVKKLMNGISLINVEGLNTLVKISDSPDAFNFLEWIKTNVIPALKK